MNKQNKQKILNEKQKRSISGNFQTRKLKETEENVIEGYAANFEVYTKIRDFWGDEYYEVIERGAFDGAIDNVIFNVNHNDDILLGRTTSGTLILTADEKGLMFSSNIPNTTQARDVYELVKRGDISECSFRFIISDADWSETKDELPVCRIKKFKRVYDVSLVTFPAYPGTEASARNEEDKSKQQLLNRIERSIILSNLK